MSAHRNGGHQMEGGFRPLDSRERALVEKLLEADFPGRDKLRGQLKSVTGKQIEPDGTLSLRCESGLPSTSKFLPVAEGVCKDADGVLVSVILHINIHGFMDMLEIIKYDGSAIINPPSASELRVLRPESRGEVSGGAAS